MNMINTDKEATEKGIALISVISQKVNQGLPSDNNGKKSSLESPRKISISDFKLIKNLGKGSYARVVMAKHITSNKLFAIKVIDKTFIEKEEKVHEVHIERILLSSFNHPNIIKLYHTFQNSKKLYFVLELAEKGDLKYFIKSQKNITYELAKFFAAEIVNALEYMHKNGFMHRDLKPENILLTADLHLRICDFSTASCYGKYFDKKERKFKDGQEENTNIEEFTELIGTAEYISPEMIENGKSYFSSDLWALGIMLYQFFHGYTPFVGSTQKKTVQKIIKKNGTEISKNIPEDAQDLIRKLIVYDQEKRLGAGVSDKINGYEALKNHRFFKGIDFENLHKLDPPFKLEYCLHSISSNNNSPMDSSFSSAYGDSVDANNLSNFKLSIESEEEKICDIKSDLEQKKFTVCTKRYSENLLRDKKSLFFSQNKIEEESNKIEEGKTKKNINSIIYEDFIEKKSCLVIYEKIKLLLYQDRLKYYEINNDKYGEIILDKNTKTNMRNQYKFTLTTNNTVHHFKSEKGSSREWCELINGVIDLL